VIDSNGVSEVTVSLDWLSEHMLSERVEVSILEGSFLVPVVVVLVLSADLVLHELKLSRVQRVVADHVTEEVDGSSSVTTVDLKAESSVLSVGVGGVFGSHVVHLLCKFGLALGGGASGGHLLQDVGGSSGGEVLVSGSRADVDSNAIEMC